MRPHPAMLARIACLVAAVTLGASAPGPAVVGAFALPASPAGRVMAPGAVAQKPIAKAPPVAEVGHATARARTPRVVDAGRGAPRCVDMCCHGPCHASMPGATSATIVTAPASVEWRSAVTPPDVDLALLLPPPEHAAS